MRTREAGAAAVSTAVLRAATNFKVRDKREISTSRDNLDLVTYCYRSRLNNNRILSEHWDIEQTFL